MSSLTPIQQKSRENIRIFWEEGRRINAEIKKQNQKLSVWCRIHRQSENPDKIYKWTKFAEVVESSDELDELLAVGPQGKAADETGRPLGWEHFIVLTTVKDRAKRLKLATIASRDELSPDEMRDWAKKRKLVKPKKGNKCGRKPLEPKEPNLVLQSVYRQLEQEVARVEQISDARKKKKFQKVLNLLKAMQESVGEQLKNKPKS